MPWFLSAGVSGKAPDEQGGNCGFCLVLLLPCVFEGSILTLSLQTVDGGRPNLPENASHTPCGEPHCVHHGQELWSNVKVKSSQPCAIADQCSGLKQMCSHFLGQSRKQGPSLCCAPTRGLCSTQTASFCLKSLILRADKILHKRWKKH